MLPYIGRRFVQAIPLLIGVSIIAFALMHLAPGGPLAVYTINPTITIQDIERIKIIFGLDQPVYIQYLKWAAGMFTGNWGYTFFGGRPVFGVIVERLPATFLLMGCALSIAIILALVVGIIGATRRYSIYDYLATTGALAALSFPTFWLGLMAIFIFAVHLGWLPSGGMFTLGEEGNIGDLLRHLALPTLVLALVITATYSRYTRSAFLEVLHQDYMRTARAKGLTRYATIMRHALKNALIPVVTVSGITLTNIITGAFFVEQIYNVPGIARQFVDSTLGRDYPLVLGLVLVFATVILVTNLLVDISYGFLDPRIRFQ
jgi:peptide/nickel transport system permease protein